MEGSDIHKYDKLHYMKCALCISIVNEIYKS